MTDWKAVQLAEIPARDGWVPVRAHFGIGAFGINAWIGSEAGDVVIGEHTEEMVGHEELYLVTKGHAAFTLDGEELDAPAGTLVYVGDTAVSRKAIAREPGTLVLAIGGKPGEAFQVSSWEHVQELYREQRYAEALDVVRAEVQQHPDRAGLRYNLACFESLTGASPTIVAEHLRRAVELDPSFTELAAGDTDFDPVRDSPEFQSAIAGKPERRRTSP